MLVPIYILSHNINWQALVHIWYAIMPNFALFHCHKTWQLNYDGHVSIFTHTGMTLCMFCDTKRGQNSVHKSMSGCKIWAYQYILLWLGHKTSVVVPKQHVVFAR